MLPSAPSPVVVSLPCAFSLALLGCASDPQGSPAEDATPTTVVFELPAGIEVGIDGEPPSELPTQPLVVEPGTRSITLRSKCQTLTASIEAAAHETTRVTPASAEGLRVAALEISANDLKGAPLRHAVTVDDIKIAAGEGSSRAQVPGCMYRVRVSSEGLGGFVEDIDFGAVADVRREVVLSPGPDMVRLQGGKFVLGPPEHLRDQWLNELDELIVSRIPVELEPFDIDRTEVTAAHWVECRRAGGCPRTIEWWTTTHPHPRDLPHCNVDPLDIEANLKQGRGNHPMNCVAHWEAEDYCRWAGKRLPTPVEWEFAARGGDPSYIWPWGNDEPTCEHTQSVDGWTRCNRARGTAPVCSHPQGSTKHGLCDVVGNVEEYTNGRNREPTPSNPNSTSCKDNGWRGGVSEPMRDTTCSNKPSQTAELGFRCARTVGQ